MTISSIKNYVLFNKTIICHSFFSRLIGMLGLEKSAEDVAYWLRPCKKVHTIGMKFPIDVYFLDRKKQVIGMVKGLKPNRFSPYYRKADSVVESAAASSDLGIRTGDYLVFTEKKDGDESEETIKKRNYEGQVSVEFAIMFFFFAILLMGLTDVIQVCYNWATLQYIVSRTTRYESLKPYSDDAVIRQKISDDARSLGVTISTNNIEFVGLDESATGINSPENYVVVRARIVIPPNPISQVLIALVGSSISQGVSLNGRRLIKSEPYD